MRLSLKKLLWKVLVRTYVCMCVRIHRKSGSKASTGSDKVQLVSYHQTFSCRPFTRNAFRLLVKGNECFKFRGDECFKFRGEDECFKFRGDECFKFRGDECFKFRGGVTSVSGATSSPFFRKI